MTECAYRSIRVAEGGRPGTGRGGGGWKGGGHDHSGHMQMDAERSSSSPPSRAEPRGVSGEEGRG